MTTWKHGNMEIWKYEIGDFGAGFPNAKCQILETKIFVPVRTQRTIVGKLFWPTSAPQTGKPDQCVATHDTITPQ